MWLRIAKRKTPEGGTVAVYTDITDLKHRHTELEEARRGAEVASQEKSRFLASMSHELRTPLNAIIGYSEMLIEDANDLDKPGFVADLGKIMGSGRHLLALINDVLDLSKIEAGKMELYIEPVSLKQLLVDVESTVAPLIAKKGNRLTVTVSVEPDEIETDKTKLRQNLFNLLSNAAKFTENDEIRLSVNRSLDERWRLAGVFCQRQRDRHDARATGKALPGVRSGRFFNHAKLRRNRAWSRDYPAFHQDDGRNHRCGERIRQGFDLSLQDPASCKTHVARGHFTTDLICPRESEPAERFW